MEYYMEEKTWEEEIENENEYFTYRGLEFSKEWDGEKYEYKVNGLLIEEERYTNLMELFND